MENDVERTTMHERDENEEKSCCLRSLPGPNRLTGCIVSVSPEFIGGGSIVTPFWLPMLDILQEAPIVPRSHPMLAWRWKPTALTRTKSWDNMFKHLRSIPALADDFQNHQKVLRRPSWAMINCTSIATKIRCIQTPKSC